MRRAIFVRNNARENTGLCGPEVASRARTDLTKVVNDELTKYFRGEAGIGDATTKAVQAGNVALTQA